MPPQPLPPQRAHDEPDRPRSADRLRIASLPFGRPETETAYLRIHRAEPSSIEACRRLTSQVAWDTIEPRTRYYRFGRPLVNVLLGLVSFPAVFVLAVLVTLINTVQYRSVRRAFFQQPRVGRRGRIFHIYKFRTMDAVHGTQMGSWSSGEEVQRVTRLGRFLRSTHLDELPQFVNIVRGEMTFIGPRPEMIEVEEWARDHVPGFATRLVLRPGITGLAQITQGYTGRNAHAYSRKLELNERYRRTISFAADVGIIAGTVTWMLRGRGWKGPNIDC
ncbi:MAG: sugar transferase [bacterium]|nr:sugar transferase [bacterium]